MYYTAEGSNLTVVAPGVLATASDVDGPTLNAVAGTFTTAKGNTVTIRASGNFTYAPKPYFNGNDTFAYTVSDGLASATATATVVVSAVNVSPAFEICPCLLSTPPHLGGVRSHTLSSAEGTGQPTCPRIARLSTASLIFQLHCFCTVQLRLRR